MAKLNFSVIGAGSGGQCFAAILAMNGHEVTLYDNDLEKIDLLKKNKKITLSGKIEGDAYPTCITDNIEVALENADVILVTVTTNNHAEVANKISSLIKNNQIVILNPGQTGGALEFYNIFKKKNVTDIPIIAETQDLLFSCRSSEPGHVKLIGIKNIMNIASVKSKDIEKVISILKPIFPQFNPVKTVLHTSIDNVGAIIHPIPTILNATKIERKIVFDYYIEGMTPIVANLVNKVDEERLSIARAFGLELDSIKNWLKKSYGVESETLYEAFTTNKAYIGIKAPESLDHRFMYEDIISGLVPLSCLGKMVGIETPAINSFIEIGSIINKCNYWESGRTLEKMGLEGVGVNEVYAMFE